MTDTGPERSVFDIVGREFFDSLVDAFYDGVEVDPVLIALYPEGSDTIGARRRLSMFLAQYWGGPDDYMQERGHPRLRMRHNEFRIGEMERDHWLMHMASALETVSGRIAEDDREAVITEMARYMVNAAEHLRNA